jgi:tryptophan-rich sensory protein
MLTGFTASFKCNIGKQAGEKVPFRPPSFVFGIVWPILYILLGISWMYANRKNVYNNIPFFILSLLLVMWIVVYGCMENKKAGVWIIALSLLASLYCYTVGGKISKYCILPMIVWLLFAMCLNMFEL